MKSWIFLAKFEGKPPRVCRRLGRTRAVDRLRGWAICPVSAFGSVAESQAIQQATKPWQSEPVLLPTRGLLGTDHVFQRGDQDVQSIGRLDLDGVASEIGETLRPTRLKRDVQAR